VLLVHERIFLHHHALLNPDLSMPALVVTPPSPPPSLPLPRETRPPPEMDSVLVALATRAILDAAHVERVSPQAMTSGAILLPWALKIVVPLLPPATLSVASELASLPCSFGAAQVCECSAHAVVESPFVICTTTHVGALGTSSSTAFAAPMLSVIDTPLSLGGVALKVWRFAHPAQVLLLSNDGAPVHVKDASFYDAVFMDETPDVEAARLRAWSQSAATLALSTASNVYINALPMVHVGASRFMVRSGFFLSKNISVVPLAHVNGAEKKVLAERPDRLQKLIGRCEVAGAQACTCEAKKNVAVCTVTAKDGFASSWPTLRFPDAGNIAIPIELAVNDRPGGFHVCVQGFLYSDRALPPVPQSFMQAFVSYYASLGASDLHVYSNALDAVRSFSGLQSPPGTRVWLHDGAFPPFNERMPITGVQRKAQLMAVNDCLVRTKAMGAKWVAVVDLDEFVSPTKHDEPLVPLLDSAYGLAHVVWMPSYIFNTAVCAPVPGHKEKFVSVAKSFAFARLDSTTYKGRRKAIYHISAIPAEWLYRWFPQTHHIASIVGLTGLTQKEVPPATRPGARSQLLLASGQVWSTDTKRTAAPTTVWAVHIHHYREPWHDNICSTLRDVAPQGWHRHISAAEAESIDQRIRDVFASGVSPPPLPA